MRFTIGRRTPGALCGFNGDNGPAEVVGDAWLDKISISELWGEKDEEHPEDFDIR